MVFICHWSSSGDQTGAKPTILNMGRRDGPVPREHACGKEIIKLMFVCVDTLQYRVCAFRCDGVGSMITV